MSFTREQMAAGFNEWMRRFEEDPTRFESEFETVRRFVDERSDGAVPSYGGACVAYLELLVPSTQVESGNGIIPQPNRTEA